MAAAAAVAAEGEVNKSKRRNDANAAISRKEGRKEVPKSESHLTRVPQGDLSAWVGQAGSERGREAT